MLKKSFYLLLFILFGTPIFASEGSGAQLLQYWYIVLPFVILLLMIATGPLFYHHFWERNYPRIAVSLGSVTVLFYLIVLEDTHSLVHTLAEYLSFIALLASLFVASGGILIKVDRKATPMLNVLILVFGSVISNVIGTTGASMLLIRPFIKINKDRIKPYHIVFFIFSVSNIGGALTPIGDPPLFLGFLRGVEFFWVIQHVWYIWLPTLIVILGIFFVIDSQNKLGADKEINHTGKIEFKGLKNLWFLLIIILSVFLDPGVISWVPSLAPLPFGLREIIMFSVVYFSYKKADQEALRGNEFDFEPIREVAYLFAGLFATMIPALQLIAYEANIFGDKLDAGLFYWATGSLSAFLDNAPTYLNFLSAEMGKFAMNVNDKSEVLRFEFEHPIYLQAISVAAVFFGAMTYIGNAPNFMVKSISEKAGINMPSFFGYLVKYSVPILLPVFAIIWYIFFYGNG
ncbi:MAG: citrate transporter [Ignavibacteriales bacterium]|jgi:Na+/H+ antiporter NhaD/arsenite permease-like protein|nr:MAG: citrate transporter [Ignavibacteriales bacterium]